LTAAQRAADKRQNRVNPRWAGSWGGNWRGFDGDWPVVRDPSGRTALDFGVTVIGAAASDPFVADVAARLHAASGGFLGATSTPVPSTAWPEPQPGLGGDARVAVVGAHLRGLPLHHELTALSARLEAVTRTAPRYRLYALAETVPPKPGLVRDEAGGAAIELEIYALGTCELGQFLSGVAAPLAIGPVELEDGAMIPGFLATAGALDAALDITHHGGWRAYIESRRTP